VVCIEDIAEITDDVTVDKQKSVKGEIIVVTGITTYIESV